MTTDETLDRAHELDGLLGRVADAMRTEVLLIDPEPRVHQDRFPRLLPD